MERGLWSWEQKYHCKGKAAGGRGPKFTSSWPSVLLTSSVSTPWAESAPMYLERILMETALSRTSFCMMRCQARLSNICECTCLNFCTLLSNIHFSVPVLSTPAFKIKLIGSSSASAPDDDDAVADVMAAASAKVVGALVKKHILQTVKFPHFVCPNLS